MSYSPRLVAPAPFILAVTSIISVSGARAEKFVWGTATAAYQVEGSRNASHRQPSVWDCFDTEMIGANGVQCRIKAKKPSGQDNVFRGDNAATADGDYTRYQETADELKTFGFGAYRMSVSWSRVLTYSLDPKTGKIRSVRKNQAGINHYLNVLNAVRNAGAEVALTMWHWDTPEPLENDAISRAECTAPGSATGSFWLCPDADVRFGEYAKLLINEFGGLVKYWITLNEPLTLISNGYAGSAPHAPGRCSDRSRCWDGNDAVEPFIAAHNLLRAHAEAFNAHKAAGTKVAGSVCGVTLNGDYAMPLTGSAGDKAAAERSLQYQMAIFADPIFRGTWPEAVVAGAGAALPPLDSKVKGTHMGTYFQNHYTTTFVWDRKASSPSGSGYMRTANVSSSGYNPLTKRPIGLPSSNGWLFRYPQGLPLLQNWLHERYPGLQFVVTENGWGNATTGKTADDEINDLIRCNYYRSYIGNMSRNAYENGVDVGGFFAWSIMDNYEWADGFSTRFGLTFVDYKNMTRTPKLSMRWFGKVTSLKQLPSGGEDELPACEDLLDE